MKLWKYSEDFGRMGSLSSVFFATDEQITELRKHSIYLSDVLGKHSEVNVEFTDENFQEIKISQTALKELHDVLGDFVSGDFYPFDYEDQWEKDEE